MEKITRSYYVYDDLIDIIEKKHNIDTSDYYGHFKQPSGGYYADYWHFMIEFLREVNAGEIRSMDWLDVREKAVEYDDQDDQDDEPGWRTKITDMIIAEVGVGPDDFLMFQD